MSRLLKLRTASSAAARPSALQHGPWDGRATSDDRRVQRHDRLAVYIPRRWVFLLAALLALTLAALVGAGSHRLQSTGSPTTGQAGYGVAAGRLAPATPIATPLNPTATATASQPGGTTTRTPTTATTPTTPTSQTSQSFPGWGLPDPTQWVQQVLATVLNAFFSGVLSALMHILAWAQGFGGSAFNFITRTPPEGTYASASVIALWRWIVGVADAALAVFVLWSGYAVMTRHALGTRAYGAMQVLPRLGLAALAANLSLLFTGGFIDLGNALSDGVGQVGLPGYATATTVQQDLAALVLAVVYAVVGFLLVAQMLLRLALLDVLIVTAPLGFLCWALPHTQAWARLWTSTFVATALVQFLQILALRLGALLVNELTPGRLDSATLTLLAGIATLYLTFKLPHMLQNFALRTVGAASMSGVIEQGVATAQAIGSVVMSAAA